ncbi:MULTISPECIES: efflux RND transporter permease subunit [Novosphingobium]|uniref:efflux RND transporter permease subunit n=1 Tax=unclassified Novosphingobium TaxID=2644732 RepID=UPI001054020A|nr:MULTISPECIES: efflux RND transporter permease subunit [unclassified Novosphingobium]MPS67992.1 efflux RND transporter permease subunit [Novosphingobium sp.]TCM41417.1 HAE1 family hydrophobic/amphiphilic exporter-1/multidrug efflux pump [Novosphingobium sp. ST904]WRT95428.1 efflux RND transporter permease subunit [Novosphingobium sp. RL4]
MSRYFIDRPIFAWVIAIVMMLAGVLAIRSLAVAQFPEIAAPAVQISTSYPGANAETLESTTTQVIEQQLKGIDHLRYFSSSSDGAGNLTVTLTFEQGTDPDIAQVQVQNKLTQATPLLPQEVQLQGLRVTKSTATFLMVMAVYADDGIHDQEDAGDFVASSLQDPISRVNGVGDTQLLGAQYSMRVWLDPYKMANLGVTTSDVTSAIQAQNAQVSAGQIGGTPSPKGQALNATITAQSRLRTAEQFRQIMLRNNTDGSVVHLSDVARVEMGAENYSFGAKLNGYPAAGFGIKLAPGANALDTVEAVKTQIDQLSKNFPSWVKYKFPVDNSTFVKLSVEQVIHTLVEAVVLVFIVMFLFLQNWRATLIPTIAVPVVLLGSLAILQLAGFTINTLTLFGMVLAIGLLVDDAIVVVENVERLIQDEGLSPKEAARRSMDEISGALVGIGLVLSAVFLPMAFFGGSTGVIFRQFSITIVSSMVLSVIVALVLTPALCATILKPSSHGHGHGEGKRTGIAGMFNRFFDWFNRTFDRGVERYGKAVDKVEHRWGRTMLVYAAIVVGMGLIFLRLPGGFLPDEDQGILMNQVSLPAGTTMEETERTLARVRDHYLKDEKANVADVFTISGFGFVGQGQNVGLAFVRMKDWSERKGAENTVMAVAQRANMAFQKITSGMVIAFAPPAVQELGNATGFEFQLVDRGGLGHQKLLEARNQFLGMAAGDKRLAQVRPNGLEDTPQIKLDVDQAAAGALGIAQADINSTISTAMGSSYVNDFIDRDRVKKVFVQADQPFRTTPESIGAFHVRGSSGVMAPISSFATTEWIYGPAKLERFNGVSSMQIMGAPAPGVSTGDAMKVVEQLATKLPAGVGLEWSGISYEENTSGGQAPALYALSMLIVFLCLAALYESWSVPIAVMLVVPLGVLGAVIAATLVGLNNDIYLQVGLITTIGVSAKNAILIVEFAEEKMRDGLSPVAAALEAGKLRLRPILMTSFAFIFGVLPLAVSTGAGAGGQNAIGWAVVGGMLSATILAIFFVPVFFTVVKRVFREHHGKDGAPVDGEASAAPQEA